MSSQVSRISLRQVKSQTTVYANLGTQECMPTQVVKSICQPSYTLLKEISRPTDMFTFIIFFDFQMTLHSSQSRCFKSRLRLVMVKQPVPAQTTSKMQQENSKSLFFFFLPYFKGSSICFNIHSYIDKKNQSSK